MCSTDSDKSKPIYLQEYVKHYVSENNTSILNEYWKWNIKYEMTKEKSKSNKLLDLQNFFPFFCAF